MTVSVDKSPWGTSNGIALLLSFFGFILLLQIIPLFNLINDLHLGSNTNDWIPIAGTLIFVGVTTACIIATIVENWKVLNDAKFEAILRILVLFIPVLIVFEAGYLVAIPFTEFLSPFVGQSFLQNISGWPAFVLAEIVAMCAVGSIWLISEFTRPIS